ncbi:hypothetical protein ACOMHN_024217 [Nucella lapillus]
MECPHSVVQRRTAQKGLRGELLRLEELEVARYSIDVAALSETRLAGEGQLCERDAGHTFFWSGGGVLTFWSVDLIFQIFRISQGVPPVLIISGTFGNVMIVVVMRGMRGSQSTACLSVYFTALAVSDQCLLMTSVLWFWIDVVFSWPPSFFSYGLLCKLPKCVWYTCSVTSAWFLVAMTYQRVTRVAVCCAKYLLVCVTLHDTTQHDTTQHDTTQHDTTQHDTTQHHTTQHETTQHDTTRHDTTRHNTTR